MVKFGPFSRRERSDLVERSIYGFGLVDRTDPQMVSAFENGATYKFGKAFAGQRNMIEAAAFINKVLIGIVFFLIIVFSQSEINKGALDWATLLVYLELFNHLPENSPEPHVRSSA